MPRYIYIYIYILTHIKHFVYKITAYTVANPGGPRGPGPPLDPKFEAPDYILRPKLHLLTHK